MKSYNKNISYTVENEIFINIIYDMKKRILGFFFLGEKICKKNIKY